MKLEDYLMIALAVIVVIGFILYKLNQKAYKQMEQAQSMIKQNKTNASIYVIDKKHAKPDEVKLAKSVQDSLTKMQKIRKMYFIQAKIGPQITTLICDKTQYNQIYAKKKYNVSLAGIYIIEVKGAKVNEENLGFFEKARRKYLSGDKDEK